MRRLLGNFDHDLSGVIGSAESFICSWYIGQGMGSINYALKRTRLKNAVYAASRRKKPLCPEILYFAAGDSLWVVGTLILVELGLAITSAAGTVIDYVAGANHLQSLYRPKVIMTAEDHKLAVMQAHQSEGDGKLSAPSA